MINQRDKKLDHSVTRRYFYTISDISIGGQCICYGHAERCAPDERHGVRQKILIFKYFSSNSVANVDTIHAENLVLNVAHCSINCLGELAPMIIRMFANVS